MKKIKAVSCIVTVMIMALIFFFSCENADASHTTSSGIAMKFAMLVSKLIRVVEAQALYDAIHFAVRKLAHFTLFFALGLSVANTIFWLFSLVKLRLFGTSVLFCAFYAATDEIHQLFVPGRAGMIGDVVIDTIGAAFGTAIFLFTLMIYKRRSANGV